MTLLAARYPDLWAIDVVNEPVKTPLPFKDALGGDGVTGWDWIITSFTLARAKFPNAKLLINEYGTENDATARNQMIAIINLLKARNLIDGIGIQAHYFNLDGMTAAQMTACLDAYAATGLDLYISELELKGPQQTEASQSAQYQIIFPAIWTHPRRQGRYPLGLHRRANLVIRHRHHEQQRHGARGPHLAQGLCDRHHPDRHADGPVQPGRQHLFQFLDQSQLDGQRQQ